MSDKQDSTTTRKTNTIITIIVDTAAVLVDIALLFGLTLNIWYMIYVFYGALIWNILNYDLARTIYKHTRLHPILLIPLFLLAEIVVTCVCALAAITFIFGGKVMSCADGCYEGDFMTIILLALMIGQIMFFGAYAGFIVSAIRKDRPTKGV